jgi:hypothetical protein
MVGGSPPLTLPITSDMCGEERRRPLEVHRKDPGHAHSLEETSGHPRVPRGGSRAPTVLTHNVGPRLAGRRHLQPRAIRRAWETSRYPRVPRGGPRAMIVLAHSAGPCLAGRRHLQVGAPNKVPHSHSRRYASPRGPWGRL